MSNRNQPLVYFACITLTEKGKRPVRHLSAYEVLRRDGTVVKEMPYIDNDPNGSYANAEVIAAAQIDAGALGLELDEKNIVVHYVRTREDASGKPY
jgi:hypothetical protein